MYGTRVPLATRATLKDRVATLLVVNFGYLPNGRKRPNALCRKGGGARKFGRLS